MKNASHSLDINRTRCRHTLNILKYTKYSKYKKYLCKMTSPYIKQHLATFEAQFIKNLSKAKAELKNGVAYIKTVYDDVRSIRLNCFDISETYTIWT